MNGLTQFWFKNLHQKNHFIDDHNAYPGRSSIVKKLSMIECEAIVRGYLDGSAWQEYEAFNTIAGVKMKSGMKRYQKLDFPLFTPSTKANVGHHGFFKN